MIDVVPINSVAKDRDEFEVDELIVDVLIKLLNIVDALTLTGLNVVVVKFTNEALVADKLKQLILSELTFVVVYINSLLGINP